LTFLFVSRIRDRVAAVLGERVEFNEILSVMYREGQKMSWHDDGEAGTLSPPNQPSPLAWFGGGI
jgi:alkylated DNA repair dioxygenase AlkB